MVFTIVLFIVTTLLPMSAQARIVVVDTYTIDGADIESGDIISFDIETEKYSLSQEENDDTVFGVVDTNPILVFRTDPDKIPIVQEDTVLVNVSTLGGDIEIGDPIITSQLQGIGQRGDKGDNIIGYALDSFNQTLSSNTEVYDGETVYTGSIAVTLISAEPELLITQRSLSVQDSGKDTPSVILTFRYVAAALFILGAFGFIFKNFGPNVAQGVKSVGRNPLAKSTIQSMVVFNLVIVFLISVVALFVSIVIIVLPL